MPGRSIPNLFPATCYCTIVLDIGDEHPGGSAEIRGLHLPGSYTLASQHGRELHQLLVSTAPFVGVRDKSFAIADVIGASGRELFKGRPASLSESGLLSFLGQHEIH
jgi:hypothetical protein